MNLRGPSGEDETRYHCLVAMVVAATGMAIPELVQRIVELSLQEAH
jgi:hypothetical protein